MTIALAKTLTVRSSMETIAKALGHPLGKAPDAGLALTVNDLPVTIAPGRNNRIAVCCQIAEARKVSPDVWISALSEAASWGLDGETMRFAVVDRYAVLLWTPAPQPGSELLPRLYETFATALAVADLARRH